MHRLVLSLTVAAFTLSFFAGVAAAQSASLYGPVDARHPLTLNEASWTFQRPVEPEPIKLHDLVTVIINEQSVVISDGSIDRKKKAYGDLKLSDWIYLKGLNAFPNPQTSGDPHIHGEIDNKMRAEGQLETRDSMKFRIACEVVDIRPNGNLVIEGRRTLQNNEETWEYALNGDIRAHDILPNNTIQSENVANLRINKREMGHVRDSYRRGWLLKALDAVQPF